jgi:transposase
VYWKPVWQVLEASFDLVLANAMHIRNIPGRKSDVTDATWIADLLAHGLIRGSFVPPPLVQALRDLTRTRKQLVREIRNTPSGSKRPWRPRTSSSPASSPTSWA